MAAPIPTDRLFFAIFPDADTIERIERFGPGLCKSVGLKGKILAAERFHISLHHIGDFVGLSQDILTIAAKAAGAVSSQMSPFETALDRATSFIGRPGHHPFVLCGSDGVAALTAFHQTLGAEMERAGLRLGISHYTPHLTLLYGDRLVAEQIIEPVAWTVREFVLVRSLLGQGRYEALARWNLAPEKSGIDHR